jgi:hypothetical protein
MIDMGMYAALGFLVASLMALMFAPPLWNRAVRLTKRRLEATLPMSAADIQADKDQLRAEFAIELRRVEVALEKAKDKAARELVEANKRRVELAEIRAEFETVKARLQEGENANRVLEQTIRRRLPELESRLKGAKEAMAALEAANAELRNTVAAQGEALKLARTTVNTQRDDIDQLRGALGVEGSSRRPAKSDASLAKENRRLSAEISKLKQELAEGRAGGEENALLRQELGKLAQMVLEAAQAQTPGLPPFAPAPFGRPSVEPDGTLGRGERRSAFVAKRDEALGESMTEPGSREEQAALAVPKDDAETGAVIAPEHRGSLARILASRKAKRRGGKTGAESLSERLKNVSPEAPDI